MTRTVPVAVLDQHNQLVNNLRISNFRVVSDKRPARIASVTFTTSPQRVVLVLDASGSMHEGEKWEAAIRAAQELLAATREDVPVALLTFSDSVEERVPFSEGRQVVSERLAVLQAHYPATKGYRKTALLDAIIEGLALLSPCKPGDILYIITDGGENASKERDSQVQKAFEITSTRLFAILLQSCGGRRQTPEEAVGPAVIQNIVYSSGGASMTLSPVSCTGSQRYWWSNDQRDQVVSSSRILYQEMFGFYSLQLKLSQAISRRSRLEITVIDHEGKRWKGLQLSYPRRLLPCSAN